MKDFKLGDRVELDSRNGWFESDWYYLKDFIVVDRLGRGLDIAESDAQIFSSNSYCVSVAPRSNPEHALWVNCAYVHPYNPIWCE